MERRCQIIREAMLPDFPVGAGSFLPGRPTWASYLHAMPRFRSDLDKIIPYRPGRSIEEVAAELGLSEIAKLASNECPFPPFPEVEEAIRNAGSGINRYPDNDHTALRNAVAEAIGVARGNLLFGAGSSDILRSIGLAMGGPGTSTVYASPSFILYRIFTHLAGSEPIEVPLTSDWRHDPERLVSALRPDTTLLYLCNPNNPTGTHLPSDQVDWVIEQVPESVLIVIDEAYHDYAVAPDFASAVPHATVRDNVIVTHTFSKAHGLAGLRVGYAVGSPATLGTVRKTQTPFPVTAVAQAAATAAVRNADGVAQRVRYNDVQRSRMAGAINSLGLEQADSQTNFIFHRSPVPSEDYTRLGVIVRAGTDGWVRTSIGLEEENDRFIRALSILGDF